MIEYDRMQEFALRYSSLYSVGFVAGWFHINKEKENGLTGIILITTISLQG